MKNWMYFVFILISCVLFGFRISKGIEFKQNVKGYLKRAADASTIELANEELTKALDYLEAKNLTSGYTSILYNTPDEDIDYWYRNLKASQKELTELKSESALEKTNVLIKLRETLLDTGESTKVTLPDGIAVYPNNKLWAFLMFLSISLMSTGFMGWAINAEKAAKEKAAVKQEEG